MGILPSSGGTSAWARVAIGRQQRYSLGWPGPNGHEREMPATGQTRDRFEISDDKARLDVARVHRNLTESYWAKGISLELVKRSIEHSLCFGLYDGDEQVGFARVITDCATFGYLSDVYVERELRGQGLGSWLIEVVRAHPDLAGLRRFLLATRDAHAFYRPHGFEAVAFPERFLEILQQNPYSEEPPLPEGVTANGETEVRFLEATLSPPSIAYTSVSNLNANQAHPADARYEPREAPSWPMGSVIQGPSSTRLIDATQRIVRVRPLAPSEGPLLRELRIGALRESPHTFGEQLEDALNRPEHEWVEQARALTDPTGPRVFIAEVDEWPAGLVLAVEDPFDTEIGRVGGMWVDPTKRRRRAGICMLEAVRGWAREREKQRLRLWVHEDSPSARAVYETFGFKYTGARKRFPREPSRELLEMDLRVEA
jgi:GNAT superfamily N-acetyltransferase